MKFVENLASYLPSLIVAYLLDPEEKDPTVPDQRPCRQRHAPARTPATCGASLTRARLRTSRSYETVCLFADVSGFTSLSEAMAKYGPEGAEHLAKHVRNVQFGAPRARSLRSPAPRALACPAQFIL